jgi:hypothetical protein
MKTEVDSRLRDEAERFQLRYRCEDCVHFEGEGNLCSHGYPTEPHRQSLLRPFVFFCKEHEMR